MEESNNVLRPASRDGDRPECVLEHQRPPDHPGDHLAERGVSVTVRAPRHGDERSELGVAEGGEAGCEAGDGKRQHDGGTAVERRDGSGQDEDAGPNDRADSQRRKAQRAEGSSQTVIGRGFGLEFADGLPPK